MRPYETVSGLCRHASGPYSERTNRMPKYVFSSTLARAEWNKTKIGRGEVAADRGEAWSSWPGRDLGLERS